MASQEEPGAGYSQILQHFPVVDFAFAYGSGAVQQGGYDYSSSSTELPMIDVIFAVDDPIKVSCLFRRHMFTAMAWNDWLSTFVMCHPLNKITVFINY